jgi:hypothetical protein
MATHDTAVYICAGLDFIPVFKFREIRTFVYADCRPKFALELYQAMRQLGFKKIVSDEKDLNIYVNSKNGVTIKYYMNLQFPNDKAAGSFLYEVKNASVLICCSGTVDRTILDYMKSGPKMFIGDNKTNYNGIDLSIIEDPGIFETYYKINIPNNYHYWENDRFDASDYLRFDITKHESLKDLCKKI